MMSGHVGLSGRAFRLSEYLHYARYTVQGLNLSRNGFHSPRRVIELECMCHMPDAEHRARPAMPRRVLSQHAECHFAVELVLGLGGRAGVCTNERGTSDAVRAGG